MTLMQSTANLESPSAGAASPFYSKGGLPGSGDFKLSIKLLSVEESPYIEKWGLPAGDNFKLSYFNMGDKFEFHFDSNFEIASLEDSFAMTK